MTGTRFGLAMLAGLAMQADPASADVKAGVDAWQAGRYGDAVSNWRALADRGDADAQFNMGQAYRLGRGVPADQRIAQSWFQKAAQQGHAQAQANLGLILYQNGDRKSALPLIRRAAERGDERAQYVLGATLFNGDLVARDWPRAYAMMSLAAAKGLPAAQTSLQQMDQTMPAADKERGKALAQRTSIDMAHAVDPSAPSMSRPVPPIPPGETPGARSAAAARQDSKMEPPRRRGVSALAQPKPAAMPARPPAPPPSSAIAGGWRIQLGAYPSQAAARTQWGTLSRRVSTLGGRQPSYEPAGRYIRLRTGPFADRGEADRACAAARAAGQACFPVRG